MAKATFDLKSPKVVSIDDALKNAKQKDTRNANFHIPADTDEILTFTGNFIETPWDRIEHGKVVDTGTMLSIELKRADDTTVISAAFGFLRTKRLLEEDGMKTFEAAFNQYATYEEIIRGLNEGVKLQVKRDDYIYPGSSSARQVDTLIFA